MTVIDVSSETFAAEVIERSRTIPVVVDFWAEWCGPCRQLGPILEVIAAHREGKAILAKVDTDANMGLTREYGVQGIPAVKAFKDGAVVDEFVGMQPVPQIERFFDRLIPNEIDALVAAGDEESLRAALAAEPGRTSAAVPLARLLLSRDDPHGALAALESVVGDFAADGLAARARLEIDPPEPPLAQPVTDALTALQAGNVEQALDLLLEALPAADGRRDDLRQVVVGELDTLGADDPLARDARRRLAAALY